VGRVRRTTTFFSQRRTRTILVHPDKTTLSVDRLFLDASATDQLIVIDQPAAPSSIFFR
jgi:hypothetical protein